MTLPSDHPYRQLSLRHIAVLQKNLQARQNLSKDLREIAMNLAITYEQIEAELIQKGIKQGIKQGIEQGIEQGKVRRSRKIALELLREGMPPEKVARLTELPIEQLPRLEN